MKLPLCVLMLVMVGAVRVHADAPITAAAMTPDGSQVLLGSQNGIEVRSWPELAVLNKLTTDLAHVHDLRFSPDGTVLLAAGGSPAESGRVEIWSWPAGKRIRQVNGHDDVVYRVAWSPDGTQWATCGGDGRCLTFSTATAERLAQYQGHSRSVLSMRYLDSRTVASTGVDQTVRLWHSDDASHVRTLDNHVGPVNDLAVQPGASSARGPVIATVSEDRTVRLWQPAIGRLMRFTRLPSPPRCVVWSSDAKYLFVGCNDGRIRKVDVESMELAGDMAGLAGRIHELAVDSQRGLLLVAGETGCRSVVVD